MAVPSYPLKTPMLKEHVRLWCLPELGHAQLLRARYVTQNFPRHRHECFGFGVIEKGALGFYYRGENVIASSGSINLVNPDEIHTGHAATEHGWAYRMFYLDAALLRNAACEITGRQEGIPFFGKGVIEDRELAAEIRALHVRLEEKEPLLLEIETRFLQMLTRLVARHADAYPVLRPVGEEPRAVRLAKAYIEDCFEQNISVGCLAGVASLSPFHFIRVFRRTVGMPPHAYLMQVRVNKAKTLIEQGRPIVEVACDTGFVDQSHLTRHFKRMLGYTPGQYRNSVQDA